MSEVSRRLSEPGGNLADIPGYSRYSLAELYQALNSIARDRHPEALAALESELNRRELRSKFELEECYYRLDKERWPGYAVRLRQQIEYLGGFTAFTAEAITEENKYRTFWRRAGAYLVDALVLAMPITILLVALGQPMAERPIVEAYVGQIQQYIVLAYFILMHARFGQTVGKMAAGVKVLDVSEARPIGFKQALLRDSVPLAATIVSTAYFVVFGMSYDQDGPTGTSGIVAVAISYIALSWVLAELITMLFNRKRRAVHDFIARSVVVRVA